MPVEFIGKSVQTIYYNKRSDTFFCTFHDVNFIFEVNLSDFSIKREISILYSTKHVGYTNTS